MQGKLGNKQRNESKNFHEVTICLIWNEEHHARRNNKLDCFSTILHFYLVKLANRFNFICIQ